MNSIVTLKGITHVNLVTNHLRYYITKAMKGTVKPNVV